MLKYPLTQQEAIVVEKLYCENKTTKQVAYEMNLSSSRINDIKRQALAKIKFGNKPIPKSKPIWKINLARLLDER